MDARRFEALKRQQDATLDEKARAKGGLEENLRRLRDEFGLKDLKTAKADREKTLKLQADLEKQEQELLAKFEAAYKEKT